VEKATSNDQQVCEKVTLTIVYECIKITKIYINPSFIS
jgi:hypothetical protein